MDTSKSMSAFHADQQNDPDGAAVKRVPMDVKASKYLVVETVMSGLCNAILNFAAAFAIFHGHPLTPATGTGSLLMDSIGETFFVTSLSVLVPSLIARYRRRAGTLPVADDRPRTAAGNLYVRAIVAGLIFTCVCVPCCWLLLPLIFPNGVSFGNVLLFKTLYGAVLGSIATWLALRKALNEVE
jgi:hypothetical protein